MPHTRHRLNPRPSGQGARQDGDAILRSLGAEPDTELRLLAEQRPRHGKLLEWRTGDQWSALTGSANLTAAALLNSTADGGNCELGVLAPAPSPLMPEGTGTTLKHLQGRRTVRPVEGRPRLLVLGALLTGAGLLQVTLAHPYDAEVAVEVSPDGSPGSWTRVGTVPAGRTAQEFAVPEFAGAVVRIVDPRAGGRSESPPVFVVHPARCARRQADEDRPRLRHGYTEEEIFTDEELGRRFRADLLRLSDRLAEHRSARPARSSASAEVPAVHDRYAACLDECERIIGRPLTLKLFGGTSAPDLTLGLEPRPEEEVPEEAVQHVTAVTAVCMGLVLSEASLTGGAPADILAARTWQAVRDQIATAETDQAEDLLIPPKLAHARVLGRAEWERLLDLVRTDDPIAPIIAELAEKDLSLEADGGIHRVTGGFTNPIPVAARVATLLGRHMETALVYAVAGGCWAFVAWRPPHLVLAAAPMWPGWRVYQVSPPSTPESRLSGGEGLPRTGLVGGPVPLGRTPPPIAQDVLTKAGTDPADLLRRFLDHGS